MIRMFNLWEQGPGGIDIAGLTDGQNIIAITDGKASTVLASAPSLGRNPRPHAWLTPVGNIENILMRQCERKWQRSAWIPPQNVLRHMMKNWKALQEVGAARFGKGRASRLRSRLILGLIISSVTACGGGGGGAPPSNGGPQPATFTVIVASGTGGSASPSTTAVTSGQSAIITIAPTPGFRITDARGCGGTLSGNRFQTAAITGDCTVTVEFAPTNATAVQIYFSFNGPQLTLVAWDGTRVSLLTERADQDPVTMRNWLRALDSAYDFYAATAIRLPAPDRIRNGLLTIAQVPATCGAGCGLLGATGIEGQRDAWNEWYNTLNNSGKFDQTPFYELGRNFWLYSPQLAYRAPDSPDAVITGFAVFMRFEAMAAANVAGADFNGRSFTMFQQDVAALVDQYLADPSQNWNNTLRVNQGLPGRYSASDLFASFVMRLKRNHGGDAFVQRLWIEAGLRQPATSTQEAVDNFILAASAAANANLTAEFEAWRWPVSTAAKAEAQARFGAPLI